MWVKLPWHIPAPQKGNTDATFGIRVTKDGPGKVLIMCVNTLSPPTSPTSSHKEGSVFIRVVANEQPWSCWRWWRDLLAQGSEQQEHLRSGVGVGLKLVRTLISCVRHLSNNTSKKTSSDVHPEEALGGWSSQTGSKGFGEQGYKTQAEIKHSWCEQRQSG